MSAAGPLTCWTTCWTGCGTRPSFPAERRCSINSSAALLGERPTETYAQLGARLGMSETAVKVTVHRLRQRYRELLREEIAHTVTRPDEIDEEMRYLFEVVSR